MTHPTPAANPANPANPGRRAVSRDGPDPVDLHIGARVRQLRTLRGLSQQRLGDACGLTFQQIQKYERGANRVGASRLWQIARALNAPVAYFFDGLAGGADAQAAETFRREHLELVRNFDRIPHEPTRRQIAGLVRIVAGEQQRALADGHHRAAPAAAE